jgi:hypothetical protein
LVATVACRALVQRVYPIDLPVGRALFALLLGCAVCTALVASHAPLALRALAFVVHAFVCVRVVGLPLGSLVAALRGAPVGETR